MRKFQWIFGIVFLQICSSLFASCECDCRDYHHKQNQLLPDIRFVLTPLVKDAAFSFLGEVGRRNFRANQTIGFAFTNEHQAKVGVEYLTQKLDYGFGSGTESKWVSQWAAGGKYRYLIDDCWVKSIDGFLDYSHSDSHKFKSITCPSDHKRLVKRRIAGAENYEMGIGTTLILCHTGTINFGVNYDFVNYKRKYHSNKNVNGVGGYLGIEHRIFDEFHLSLKGEFYEAYNYAEARLVWLKPVIFKGVSLGLFGNYTQGRNKLPSASVIGLEIGYSFNIDSSCYCYGQSFRQYSSCTNSFPQGCAQDGWLSEPAVYIPVVLTIAEQKVKKYSCIPTSTAIPIQSVSTFPTTIDIKPYFDGHGKDLTYTFSPSIGSGFVTSDDGTIIVYSPVEVVITVTATNVCGSTSQAVTVTTPR